MVVYVFVVQLWRASADERPTHPPRAVDDLLASAHCSRELVPGARPTGKQDLCDAGFSGPRLVQGACGYGIAVSCGGFSYAAFRRDSHSAQHGARHRGTIARRGRGALEVGNANHRHASLAAYLLRRACYHRLLALFPPPQQYDGSFREPQKTFSR